MTTVKNFFLLLLLSLMTAALEEFKLCVAQFHTRNSFRCVKANDNIRIGYTQWHWIPHLLDLSDERGKMKSR